MRLPRRLKKAVEAQLADRPRTWRQRRLAVRYFVRLTVALERTLRENRGA